MGTASRSTKRFKRLTLRLSPCRYCGKMADTWDHAVPRSRGGSNARTNLYPCCYSCNQRKADRTHFEYALTLAESEDEVHRLYVQELLRRRPDDSSTAEERQEYYEILYAAYRRGISVRKLAALLYNNRPDRLKKKLRSFGYGELE